MNGYLVEVRRLTRRLSIVLTVLVEDLLKPVGVHRADLATISITVSLDVLNRLVDILVITGLNGSDHVLLFVKDCCSDGKAGNTRPSINFRCVLLVLCAVPSRFRHVAVVIAV